MRNRSRRPARAAAAALLAGAFLLGTLGTASAETVRIRGLFDGGYVWKPKTRSITTGTTIRWKAVEGNHNVQSRGPNWNYFRNLPQGTAANRTFNRSGTFRFYCTIHGDVEDGVCTGMCGKIVVS